MQHVLMQQVPDERVDHHARSDRGKRLPQSCRAQRERHHAQRGQRKVRHDRIMLEIGRH
jgi:hypothetical protein